MSKVLYDDLAGLRFWTDAELKKRDVIRDLLVTEVDTTLRDLNQMWRTLRVEAPVMMPMNLMSGTYTGDDVFILQDAPGGTNQYALRPETTNGTYLMAELLMKEGAVRPPFALWQVGPSFRRELSDGATAAKLRFNQFNQLEFQLICSADTKAPFEDTVRDHLRKLVEDLTGLEARLIESDRLPSYSEETIDIEVNLGHEWREVCSTSKRNDCPQFGNKGLRNFEVAFGIDRMTVLSK